jgi:hypothetical protein
VTTAAKPHNHRMCPVIEVIADRVAAGAEPWGTRHDMPPVPGESAAREIKQAFYSARYCKQLTSKLGEPLSVQCDFGRIGDKSYQVWVRVWPRSVAKAEIARRVNAGEPLAYNVLRVDS